MRPQDVQKAKKSVVKIMGVHTTFNWSQPYIDTEEVQFGGTAFFVDPKQFGDVPFKTDGLRFLLTNFHVVDSIDTKQVEVCIPSKGFNRLRAKVIHVVPAMDVAILCLDPLGEHPAWRTQESVPLFLEEIPNLKLNQTSVKGNSQDVIAIGFPSLSTDYQLCEGCVSGRGLGFIQLNLSLNGGNSGGPLLHKNKVIGICTASEADAEAIGLAVPINQILCFFRNWADFSKELLKIPSWGIHMDILTDEYLKYHDINKNNDSIQGVLVSKVIKNQAGDKCGLKTDDIIIGIHDCKNRYKVDFDGLVAVEWTDKRVPINDTEFILSLDPKTIEMCVYKHSKKKRVTVKICPTVIDFKTDEKHHCWENIPYVLFGGTVWMNLAMNHMEEEDDDESIIPSGQSIPLANEVKRTMNMEHIVVCTHIPGQTYMETQRVLKPFDILKKINNIKVKNVKHMKELIINLAKNMDKKTHALFELHRCKLYVDLEQITQQEIELMGRFPEPLFTSNIKVKRNRKRRRVYNAVAI